MVLTTSKTRNWPMVCILNSQTGSKKQIILGSFSILVVWWDKEQNKQTKNWTQIPCGKIFEMALHLYQLWWSQMQLLGIILMLRGSDSPTYILGVIEHNIIIYLPLTLTIPLTNKTWKFSKWRTCMHSRPWCY